MWNLVSNSTSSLIRLNASSGFAKSTGYLHRHGHAVKLPARPPPTSFVAPGLQQRTRPTTLSHERQQLLGDNKAPTLIFLQNSGSDQAQMSRPNLLHLLTLGKTPNQSRLGSCRSGWQPSRPLSSHLTVDPRPRPAILYVNPRPLGV